MGTTIEDIIMTKGLTTMMQNMTGTEGMKDMKDNVRIR